MSHWAQNHDGGSSGARHPGNSSGSSSTPAIEVVGNNDLGYYPDHTRDLPPIFPTQFHPIDWHKYSDLDDYFCIKTLQDLDDLPKLDLGVPTAPDLSNIDPQKPPARVFSADLVALESLYFSKEARADQAFGEREGDDESNALVGYWEVDTREWTRRGARAGRVLLRFRTVELVIWTDEQCGKFCIGTGDVQEILYAAIRECRTAVYSRRQLGRGLPAIFCQQIAGNATCVRQKSDRPASQPPTTWRECSSASRGAHHREPGPIEVFHFQWCVRHPGHQVLGSDVQLYRAQDPGPDQLDDPRALHYVQLDAPADEELWTVRNDPKPGLHPLGVAVESESEYVWSSQGQRAGDVDLDGCTVRWTGWE